jgi:hypothetical protein
MTGRVRRLAASAVAVALVATLPLVCPCPPSRVAAPPGRDAHDCCAPSTGVQAVDDACCGGTAATMPDSIAPAAASTAPPPSVAVVTVALPSVAPSRLVVPRAPLPGAPSPPAVLRI